MNTPPEMVSKTTTTTTQLEHAEASFLLNCIRVAQEQFRNHAFMLRSYQEKQEALTGLETVESVTGVGLDRIADLYDDHCVQCVRLLESLGCADAIVLEVRE